MAGLNHDLGNSLGTVVDKVWARQIIRTGVPDQSGSGVCRLQCSPSKRVDSPSRSDVFRNFFIPDVEIHRRACDCSSVKSLLETEAALRTNRAIQKCSGCGADKQECHSISAGESRSELTLIRHCGRATVISALVSPRVSQARSTGISSVTSAVPGFSRN